MISVTRLRATYICPWLNKFSKLKLMTVEFKPKPCTLWILHAHDNISDRVKVIIDAIFNFRMSFRLLNPECFIFPGISDDKVLATMVWCEKKFSKWNLRPSIPYLWRFGMLMELVQFYQLMQSMVFIFIW